MNNSHSFDDGSRLREHMEGAVGGLRAPDVVPGAIARGRRQRTHRRLAYGAGGLAAVTALAVAVPALAGGSSPNVETPVATGTPTSNPPAATPTDAQDDPCGAPVTGWWSKPTTQIKADLLALLPAGVSIGVTEVDGAGIWGGNLVAGNDEDFASLTLLPPPGVPGGSVSLEGLSEGGPCFAGGNDPMQAVQPCDATAGVVSCEEIRSESGELVGLVTERVEQTVVDGQDQPTDKTYVLATVAAPQGGHVELYVAEGTRADRPDTVHDPADVPALTMEHAMRIVSDPGWTS